jgi:hypothetical protein
MVAQRRGFAPRPRAPALLRAPPSCRDLSPTDPVFIAAIFAFDAVPARLGRLLNVESGSSLAA